MRPATALSIALTLLAAPLAAEQDGSPIEPGTRVRLTSCYSALATACMKSAGTLSSWRTDSVLMQPEGKGAAAVGVPRAWVTHIEVSRGRKTSIGKGTVIGFIPGLLILAGTTLSADPGSAGGPGCYRDCLMTASLGVSVLGAALGAFIGTAVTTEHWQDLPLPPQQQ